MTITVKSATDANKYYFVTLDANNTATGCGCRDRAFRPNRAGGCKHMQEVTTQVARALAFAQLKEQYDVRSETQKAIRREQYCADFAIYGE